MATEPPGLRELLRAQRVFPDGMPEFDPHAAQANPVTLFLRWLEAAVKDAVPAPRTMTLATADDQAVVARADLQGRRRRGPLVLRLRLGQRQGPGPRRQPARRAVILVAPAGAPDPRPRHGCPAGRKASAADFLARPPASRAEALIGRQSEPLDDLAELDRAFQEAQARVDADPGLVAPDWTLYALTAEEAEFWQGDLDRRHVRLRYRRAGSAWTRQLLWP